MKLVRRLAELALREHPERAATVLERLGEDEAIRLLARGDVASVATILPRLSPQYSTAVLQGLSPDRAAQALESLSVDVAARLARRMDQTRLAEVLTRLSPPRARSVQAVLGFREGSAGALMDPDVLALPQELSAREALQRVRKASDLARYNVYVIDQEQRLVGVLNLRELLNARGGSPLSDLMIRDPHRLLATADRVSVLVHPGWREVHALPVVDEGGAYLGAVRYRALRELEEELRPLRGLDADASDAFGQVIAAGARGLLAALSETASSGSGGSDEG